MDKVVPRAPESEGLVVAVVIFGRSRRFFLLSCGAPIIYRKVRENKVPNYKSLFYINKNKTKYERVRFFTGIPFIVII